MEPSNSDMSGDRLREIESSITRGLPVVTPANMLPVQVKDTVIVAPGVIAIHIVLPGTSQAPAPYLPGQFVTLALPTPRDTLYRSYSLCGSGVADEPWELTIKRMENGAVSTFFYNSVRVGTLLYASLPRGTFILPAQLRPEMVLNMIAIGSGITPIMGMIRAVARMPAKDRPLVNLFYGSRNANEIIFGDELRRTDPEQTWLCQRHYLSDQGRRVSAERILAQANPAFDLAHWYVCGPDSLKHDLMKRLSAVGVPADRVHAEVFATSSGPAYRIESRGVAGIGGGIRVADTGAVLDVHPQETLLMTLERHGYRPESSCRAGACGACKLRVVEGQVDPVGEVLSPAERKAGYVLSCIARPIGEVTLASGGRPPAGVARVAGVGEASTGMREGTKVLVRLTSAIGVGALLLGTWNMTDHRPASWGTVSAASQVSSNATAPAPTGPSTQTAIPSATRVAVNLGVPPPPTPTATPRPAPPPVATTAPSAP